MAVIDFNPEDMDTFLAEIDEANAQFRDAAEKVENAVKEVEPKWQGDAQRAFLRFYGDWRRGINLHNAAMKKSAEQLRRMTEGQLQG